MANQQPSRILWAILVIVVIVVAGVAAAFVYELNRPKSTSPILTVQVGDNVTVNYIGEFGSGPQTGHVFDTSFYSVATNNLSYPKSLEYTPRGTVQSYTPLGVYVGSNAPSSGYTVGNISFSTVVTGFWQGLIGLPGNQSHSIVVPPNLGYGPSNVSCLTTSPRVYTVPVLTFVPASEFATEYPGDTATVGAVFSDPTYGWNDTVFAVNETTVTVQSLAAISETTHPDGLPFAVSNLTSTTITLSSLLTPADAGVVLGHVSGSGLCGKTEFIVSAVDLATGTLTEDYNSEVQGETLDFVVTVVDIYPA